MIGNVAQKDCAENTEGEGHPLPDNLFMNVLENAQTLFEETKNTQQQLMDSYQEVIDHLWMGIHSSIPAWTWKVLVDKQDRNKTAFSTP